MTAYQLVALRFDQVIKRNSEGRPIEVVKHRTGSIISRLDRSEVERLLKAGAIVPIDDDDEGTNAERETAEAVEAAAEAERIKAWLSAETQWTEQQSTKTAESAQPPAAQPLVRPKAASTKPLWEAYATERGINVAGLDKDEIIAAVDALDAK
ncbi:lipase chaperone [Rhodococcus sp. IEGM 1409]|uniref:lipase chaperone n=1 Tax=Rhodococcus sp. IEGM 1409 TaxID=3047082 RepID=UPI0024B859E1|nr:lipase chaperone [Rhodococcus sp. IEGM 1409]MDI9901311.1 lipase chaperone [Rhodococcus sp. IEGM 1409]